MRIKTLVGLARRVKSLCGVERYFSIRVEISYCEGVAETEWTVYHEDIGHYKGKTPNEAYKQFKTKWSKRKRK